MLEVSELFIPPGLSSYDQRRVEENMEKPFAYFAQCGETPFQLKKTAQRNYILGCYFTKYCKEIAETIGIVGWVKNSKNGTIVGKIQGVKTTMDQMIDWLSTTGSPGCKIDKCDLTNKEYLARLDYNNFSIRF